MLSYIQNQILKSLIVEDNLSYSDTKPQGIDKDLYNYHLRFLILKGYISKSNDGYSLSEFGKKYVQSMDVLGNQFDYFKVSCLAYVTRMNGGVKEILLHKRSRHPYKGDWTTVSGKILATEMIEDCASRKLAEETGLICNNFRIFGIHRKIRKDKNGKLIEDTFYNCCIGSDTQGSLIDESAFGTNKWVSFDEAIELESKNITAHKNNSLVLKNIRDDKLEFFYFQDVDTLKDF